MPICSSACSSVQQPLGWLSTKTIHNRKPVLPNFVLNSITLPPDRGDAWIAPLPIHPRRLPPRTARASRLLSHHFATVISACGLPGSWFRWSGPGCRSSPRVGWSTRSATPSSLSGWLGLPRPFLHWSFPPGVGSSPTEFSAGLCCC